MRSGVRRSRQRTPARGPPGGSDPDGLRSDRAVELVGDIGWRVYEAAARPLTAIARLRHRDPHQRMALALRLLLRFPFSAPGRPGYEVDVADTGHAVFTTWTWCPPQAFVRDLIDLKGDHGELEVFRASWCAYDWQFNDLLAGGRGAYERPHTLSYEDDRCDMRWVAEGPTTSVRIGPERRPRPVRGRSARNGSMETRRRITMR